MMNQVVLLVVATASFSFAAVADRSSLYNAYPDDSYQEDFSDDPVYQPRFLPIFQDTAAMGKVVEALRNPQNKTLQDDLINTVADVALKGFGGDETVKRVVEVVKNRGNKTVEEIFMNVAAEIALVKFKGDETIKKVAEILKNPGNETLQENLINLVADVADSKLGKDGTLKRVAEVLKKPGNRTLQENLLDVVVEVAISKFGNDELIKKVAEVFQNSGNKTVQENLLKLATNVALVKFGKNPIVKLVAEVIQNSGNLTMEERLSAAADAALNGALGPVQAAIIKQGIGIAGQALKVGGGMLGEAMTNMGGDSFIGKAGKAISNGTQTVGGFMSKFGGGDQGVGLAIEKFGESIKKKNASIEEALAQAGSVLRDKDLALVKEVDVLANEAQTTGGDTIEEEITIKKSAKDLLGSSQPNEEAIGGKLVKGLVSDTAETSQQEANIIMESASLPTTELGKEAVVPKNYVDVGGQVEEIPQENVDVTEDAISSVTQPIGITPQSYESINEEQALTSSTQLNNFKTESANGKVTVGLQGYPGQSSVTQGGNANPAGALGSASSAIEAARHALEVGSEALGSITGVGSGQSNTQGSGMNIEITTVKLQMS